MQNFQNIIVPLKIRTRKEVLVIETGSTTGLGSQCSTNPEGVVLSYAICVLLLKLT